MLSAARSLLNSEKIANEQDLLVSTCLEVLSDGPTSLDDVKKRVDAIWPGARLTKARISEALEHCSRSGLCATLNSEDLETWALTKAGQNEAVATDAWFSDALNRLSAQIQERATQDFGGVTSEQAGLWARTLLAIFSDAVSASPDAYRGAVSRTAGGEVRPVTLDGAQMVQVVDRLNAPQGTKDFLKACLLAALDESDPFANEIVNYVATSCVLHSIIAGRSRAAARDELGHLTGQRIVIDTPVLVAYLGPDDTASHLATVIRSSREAGMEVIAPQHVLDELVDVIDRVEEQYIPGLLQSLKGGISARVYAGSVNEQVLELFLDAVEARRYRSWTEFATRARALASELETLGVTVRDHGNNLRQTVDKLAASLTEEVERSAKQRGAKQVSRDAESMEMVWRARRRADRDQVNLWPGGWLVTYDRKIGPAYARSNSRDPQPLVLTPGQWATLVTEAAPGPEVRELIDAAASFVRQEAVLRISVKYPPEVAMDLARTLDRDSVTETDIRVAQLSLTDLLDGAGSSSEYSRESISTFVSNKRASRQAIAADVQRRAFANERDRMADTVSKSAAALSATSSARDAARQEVMSTQTEVVKLRAQMEAMEKSRDELAATNAEYVSLNGRRTFRVAIVIVAAVAALLLFVLSLPGFAIGTIVGGLLFLRASHDWVTSKSYGHGRLFYALIPEVLGIFDVVNLAS